MTEALRGIEWLGHASFRIRTRAGVVYIDPYRVEDAPPADLILITHDHFDHFSRADILRLAGRRTTAIGPATVMEQLRGRTVSVRPGETFEFDELEIEALPAYNTNKLDSSGKPFHSRDAGWLGFVLRDGPRRIYHSGDTDVIPEMDQAAGVDVALLPVSGTYVMSPLEAAEAARRIDPGGGGADALGDDDRDRGGCPGVRGEAGKSRSEVEILERVG